MYVLTPNVTRDGSAEATLSRQTNKQKARDQKRRVTNVSQQDARLSRGGQHEDHVTIPALSYTDVGFF
jgi:hypothetical protein